MKSIRERTSWQDLKQVDKKPWLRGPTPEIRNDQLRRWRVKHTQIREAQQKENGLEELPFTLIEIETQKKVKTAYMSGHDAATRNLCIKVLGMVWVRSGY